MLLRLVRGAPVGELERLYVEAFDFTKQCSLHLTYHLHGDRRQRGHRHAARSSSAYRGGRLRVRPATSFPTTCR